MDKQRPRCSCLGPLPGAIVIYCYRPLVIMPSTTTVFIPGSKPISQHTAPLPNVKQRPRQACFESRRAPCQRQSKLHFGRAL